VPYLFDRVAAAAVTGNTGDSFPRLKPLSRSQVASLHRYAQAAHLFFNLSSSVERERGCFSNRGGALCDIARNSIQGGGRWLRRRPGTDAGVGVAADAMRVGEAAG
jgi:hypothetical protein